MGNQEAKPTAPDVPAPPPTPSTTTTPSEKPKCKACCACPETKKVRDSWWVFLHSNECFPNSSRGIESYFHAQLFQHLGKWRRKLQRPDRSASEMYARPRFQHLDWISWFGEDRFYHISEIIKSYIIFTRIIMIFFTSRITTVFEFKFPWLISYANSQPYRLGVACSQRINIDR